MQDLCYIQTALSNIAFSDLYHFWGTYYANCCFITTFKLALTIDCNCDIS